MKKNWHGFTLIEMLVIIAIISILATLMMPSLMSALDNAKKMVCQSNLRQIYLCTLQYCDDNEGWAPPYGNWSNLLKDYAGLGNGHYGTNTIFYCPAAIEVPKNRERSVNCAYCCAVLCLLPPARLTLGTFSA